MGTNKIDNVEDLLSLEDKNISILEEEIDLDVQKRYFIIAKRVARRSTSYKLLCEHYIQNISDLYSEDVNNVTKRSMLVTLATIADVSVYRALENFSKQDTVLQKWAIIALQQSRITLQNSLTDIPSTFISSGLGGKGKLLRYFSVIFHQNEGLKDFEEKILREEIDDMLKNLGGSLEDIEVGSTFTKIICLLPVKIDMGKVFKTIVDESNVYGNFLRDNVLITNTKRLPDSEIYDLVAKFDASNQV